MIVQWCHLSTYIPDGDIATYVVLFFADECSCVCATVRVRIETPSDFVE